MIPAILFLLLGAVVGGLFAHDAGYRVGWDDGYNAAERWLTRMEITPARGEPRRKG